MIAHRINYEFLAGSWWADIRIRIGAETLVFIGRGPTREAASVDVRRRLERAAS